MGHNVVASINFVQPMAGHCVEVQGYLLDNDNRKHFSADKITLIVDGSNKAENLRFFIPNSTLPDGLYKAGAMVYDITDGAHTKVMDCFKESSAYFYVNHANDKYLPYLVWENIPETTTTSSLNAKVSFANQPNIPQNRGFTIVNDYRQLGIIYPGGSLNSLDLSKIQLYNGLNMIYADGYAEGSLRIARVVYYNPDQPSPIPSVAKPQLTWIFAPMTSTERQIKIKVGVKSASTITSANLYVNGQQVRGVIPVKNDGYDMIMNQSVTLNDGVNIVKAVITNSGGTVTEEREIIFDAKPIVNPTKKNMNLKRIALVVGNSKYIGQELANTVNDASAISSKLQALGFDVIYITDTDRRTLDNKINEFGQMAQNYDVAMFYYAGHGIQYHGSNYLIPVDANLASESDIEYESTNVNRILSKLEESGCPMKIIALDACRNNPFERSWHRAAGGGRGLSALNAPIGTFISYATSPGTTAADGETNHSPYTTALLDVLNEKDLPIETVFKRVASKVFELTNKKQTPWYSSSFFDGDFIFNPSK